MSKAEFFYAYYRRNGFVYCMKWHKDTPLHDIPIPGTKVTITEEEFYGPLRDLEHKHPFKE